MKFAFSQPHDLRGDDLENVDEDGQGRMSGYNMSLVTRKPIFGVSD